MKKFLVIAVAVLLCVGFAAAQAQAQSQTKASAKTEASASAQAGGQSASLQSGTTFEAELSKSVEAKKCKPGDRVEAKATKDVKSSADGQVIVPKGSRIVGRVTEAKARGEGQAESSLGILFEKAVTKDGREIPLNVVIQAVAASHSTLAAESAAHDSMAMTSTAGSAAGSGSARAGGGGLVGGVTSTAGGAVGATTGAVGGVGQTAGATLGATTQTGAGVTGAVGGVGGLDATGNFTSSSSGVLGLRGLALQSESAGAASGSVISSSTQNVRLDSGTRFLLRAAGESKTQAQE
jgi:hypothetical protein